MHGTARDFGGVAGTSLNRVGVYGQVEDGVPVPVGVHAGVIGAASTQPGVYGYSKNSLGVTGYSYELFGVNGLSVLDKGVHGQSLMDTGVLGLASFDSGPLLPNQLTIAGVVGTSLERHGVIGTSTHGAGLVGYSTTQMGVYAETGATGPNSSAGYFRGNVFVVGSFTVVGGTKAAAVPFPDGSQRALYCMESPELWFEDFGTARLKRGRAVVKLDADFAKVIKRGDYRVFPAPEGDCRGLFVHRKSATTFEVRELMGGKSSIEFSYRIVGRRKDIQRHKRFAKIDTRLPMPAARARRRAPTLRAFRAELEREARARATPAMRKSDSDFAAKPPANVEP